MLVDTQRRTEGEEIMDDFNLKGKELQEIFLELEKVNKWLGGNRITIAGIEEIREKVSEDKLSILDVGCGDGGMLREVADFGRKRHLDLELTGIDANPDAIRIARNKSEAYPEIVFRPLNVFSDKFEEERFDIVLCTLTLHHFNMEEIRQLLHIFVKISRKGIVINDLQRSKGAYYLFQVFSKFFMRSQIARKDGLTSILRSFKKEELEQLGSGLEVSEQKIRNKWAFRYQWVLIR